MKTFNVVTFVLIAFAFLVVMGPFQSCKFKISAADSVAITKATITLHGASLLDSGLYSLDSMAITKATIKRIGQSLADSKILQSNRESVRVANMPSTEIRTEKIKAGKPSTATTPVAASTAQYYIENYINYVDEWTPFYERGWLVTNSQLQTLLNVPGARYTHVSLASTDGDPEHITLVLSGVTAQYNHVFINGTDVLETVHPCPKCFDKITDTYPSHKASEYLEDNLPRTSPNDHR